MPDMPRRDEVTTANIGHAIVGYLEAHPEVIDHIVNFLIQKINERVNQRTNPTARP